MDYNFIVGFSRAKAWYKIGSTVIQEVEKRNFSHVYIRYICPLTNIELISQASHGMVNEISLENFLKDNIVVKQYQINCCEKQFMDILVFIKKNLGVKYSRLQLLVIGFKKIFRISKIQNINTDEEYICSEWGARICEVAELEKAPENIDTFTPSDMQKLLIHLDEYNDRVNEINK